MLSSHKKAALLVLFVAAVIAVRLSPLGNSLTLENLAQDRDSLLVIVNDHYVLSVVSFIGAYIAIVGLSIPGGTVLTLAAGFLYGAPLAVLYVNIGATAGAALAFLAARYLLGDWVQTRYSDRLRSFNEEIKKYGSRYLLTLRLMPAFPFFLINLLAGFTKIPLRTFIWTTALGIIPGTAVYAFAGQQLGTITSLSDVVSARTLIAFAILALFALLPAVWRRQQTTRNRL